MASSPASASKLTTSLTTAVSPDVSTMSAPSTEASTSAVTLVFDIPELLENILLHLGIKQLFGVKRVRRSFNDMIDESHSLQRAMFLREGDDTSVNPLLLQEGAIPILSHAGFTWKMKSRYSNHVRCSFDLYLKGEQRRAIKTAREQSWRHTKITAKGKRFVICDHDKLVPFFLPGEMEGKVYDTLGKLVDEVLYPYGCATGGEPTIEF